MSFSSEVKTELCEGSLSQRHCLLAQCYGMLLFSRAFQRGEALFQTEQKLVMDEFCHLVTRFAKISLFVKKTELEIRRGVHLYTAYLKNSMEKDILLHKFHQPPHQPLSIQMKNIERDCCKSAFIKGAFLVCGTITNPEKDYHLEFVVHDKHLCQDFLEFAQENAVPLKHTARKNHQVLYIKESEYIEDVLTLMGAVKSSLSIMDVKIMKDVRNKVNRMTNCETANIDKTVTAAYQQVQDIAYIQDVKGLEFLPDTLQEIALLRLENQEASLSELSELAGSSISRSGINHRLKKISSIAKEIRQTQAASRKDSK